MVRTALPTLSAFLPFLAASLTLVAWRCVHGRHLDEVEDDDDLDIKLPLTRHRVEEKRCPPLCTNVVVCCVVS